jgi:hypothetical protein
VATWELLRIPRHATKSGQRSRILDAFGSLNGVEVVSEYKGDCPWLVVWGASGPQQKAAALKHRAKGGNVLCLDFGYFERGAGSVRMSVNSPHPQHLAKYAIGKRAGFVVPPLEPDFYNPDGPVLLAAMSAKSRLGLELYGWEQKQVEIIKSAYPEKCIIYKTKKRSLEKINGTLGAQHENIKDALRGCALGVVHASNVGIDCAVFGIPCIAFDGIAASVYPNKIGEIKRLLGEERDAFLHQCAWFSYTPQEFGQMLEFAVYLGEKVK